MRLHELRKKKNAISSIYAIALVENPAIEIGFVALSGSNIEVRLAINKERRMIYTPVLIPDQKINRMSENGEPFQIFFSKETIEEAAHDYMHAKLTDNFNKEHTAEKLNGVSVVETWIIEDGQMDKAKALGFDLPSGTFMQGIKIKDDKVWEDIKLKKYKGVSIEGLFDNYEVKQLINNSTKMSKKTVFAKLAALKTLLLDVKMASQELTDGRVIYTDSDSFDVGASVYADESMETALTDGTYSAGDKKITVENGVVSAVGDVELEAAEGEESKVEELAGYVAKIAEKLKALEIENAKLSEKVTMHETKLAKVAGVPLIKSATKLSSNPEQMSKGMATFNKLINN